MGSTPCKPKIWILAREKPHCGVSGVPFIKSTTGAVDTALSIADLVSSDSSRAWRKEGPWKDGARKAGVCGFKKFAGRDRGRNAWTEYGISLDSSKPQKRAKTNTHR